MVNPINITLTGSIFDDVVTLMRSLRAMAEQYELETVGPDDHPASTHALYYEWFSGYVNAAGVSMTGGPQHMDLMRSALTIVLSPLMEAEKARREGSTSDEKKAVDDLLDEIGMA
jgi:hypothetical protein